MSSKRSMWLNATMMIAMFLFCGWNAQAREKPQVIRHDGHYLDLAVNINVQWQSPNPIAFVRVFIGNDKNEIPVDAYDNRRNREGYWGEATVFVKITPNMYQNSIPYVIQIEDDLRQKSEQVQGSIRIVSPNKRTSGDDAWGRQHLGTSSTQSSQQSQQDTGYSYGSGQQDTGYSSGSGQQDTGYSYGSDQQDTGYSSGSDQQDTGYSYGSDQQDTGYSYGSDQQDTGSQGGDTQSGGGPVSIQGIEVITVGPGYVDFKLQVSSSNPIRDVWLSVVDSNGNSILEPQTFQTDSDWDGTTGAVVLNSGTYKVIVKVVDDKGNSSSEQTKEFSVQ